MKSGIDYFPLDVALDSKMELIEAEFGLTGFGVVVKLLGEIYGKQGYYIEWTEEVALLFSRKIGLGGSVVSEIVGASIKRGVFDQDIFDKYRILTSRGIQKRYFEAVSRRKEFEVEDGILLVDPTLICKNVYIKHKNEHISSKNADISKQSKVEKSRVKKSKEDGEYSVPEEPNELGKAVAYFQDRINPSPPSIIVLEIQEFLKSMDSEVITAAIDEAISYGKPNWSYIKGILNNWRTSGIKCKADVDRMKADKERKRPGNNKHISINGGDSEGDSL